MKQTNPKTKIASENKPEIIRAPLGIKVTTDENGIPTIHAHKTSQIETIEQLLESANIDQNVWEVERGTINNWMNMSKENGLVPLKQVKVTLKRKDVAFDDIAELVNASIKAAVAASKVKIPVAKIRKKNTKTGTLVEFNIPDFHYGKLSWAEETGWGNWDCNIAKKVWEDAVEDLLARSPEADEAWFILGNDFYNVDNEQRMTTGGTPQDEDGRVQKTFCEGRDLAVWAVRRLRSKYNKVKVIVVPGNHDKNRTFMLGAVIEGVFNADPGVEVDNRPGTRKYFQWGNVGIGFAHGDKTKVKDLCNLCQTEARQIWGNTTSFELHLGHLHHDIVKNMGGVTMRWLPALCPPDAWHAASGYSMSQKAAKVFVYSERGLIDEKTHLPNPDHYK